MPRISMLINYRNPATGRDVLPYKSPLDIGRIFRGVNGADKFGFLALRPQNLGSWMHATMQPYGPDGTFIPSGGWPGVIYFPPGEPPKIYAEPMFPLTPVLGGIQSMPRGGDSAGPFSQYDWSWDSSLGGSKPAGVTHREKNIFLREKIETGSNQEKYIIDCRSAMASVTEGAINTFAAKAITEYRKGFTVTHPNVQPDRKVQRGVDIYGCPTLAFGMYVPGNVSRTETLLEKVDPLLEPEAYICDDMALVSTLDSIVGSDRVYPAILTNMGNVEAVIRLINSTLHPEVVIECLPADALAVATELANQL